MVEMPNYTGERVVPWDLSVGMPVMSAHVARYAWAMQFVYGKTVIDLGCGCGYGAHMLSWGARDIAGYDVDPESVNFANSAFMAGNLKFFQKDIEAVDVLPPAQVYLAFEVLEHLHKPYELIPKIRGTLIWSLPVGDGSRFHRHVYSAQEAVDFLPGSSLWFQGDGVIVPKFRAWFDPSHVIGVWRRGS